MSCTLPPRILRRNLPKPHLFSLAPGSHAIRPVVCHPPLFQQRARVPQRRECAEIFPTALLQAPSCPASYSTALTSTTLSGSAAWWGENNGNNKSGGKSPAGSTSSPPNGEGGASTASGQTTATPSVSPSDSGSPQAALSSERKSAEKQQEEGQSSSSSSSNNNNNNKSSSNNNGNEEVKAKHDATEMMRMGPEGKMSVSNLLLTLPARPKTCFLPSLAAIITE